MKKETIQGSYTIEAALLMGILLPVLVGIIYMGFFLHDRGFLQGAAHEAAVYASLHADDKTMDVAAAAKKLVLNRTLGIRAAEPDVETDEKRVQVSYEGSFQAPGMARSFFGASSIPVRSEVALTLERPSKRIRKIRGIAKIVGAVRRMRG